ncbi:hypothetical protein DFH06DRAFT_1247645, partial [Mycena polygramma]
LRWNLKTLLESLVSTAVSAAMRRNNKFRAGRTHKLAAETAVETISFGSLGESVHETAAESNSSTCVFSWFFFAA